MGIRATLPFGFPARDKEGQAQNGSVCRIAISELGALATFVVFSSLFFFQNLFFEGFTSHAHPSSCC
jgi:hypothetical protein